MYDYGLSVMEQYEMTVLSSRRGRGALICQTTEGMMLLRPFSGSRKRLEAQQKFLLPIYEEYRRAVDVAVPNQEGELVSRDGDGNTYVLRRWYEGRECDVRVENDIMQSVGELAELHKVMGMPLINDYAAQSLQSEYVRHNRELRKIQRFIRQKKSVNRFEREYLNSVEEFLQWGQEALESLEKSGYEQLREKTLTEGRICHGEFNQHHVLLKSAGAAVTGFDKWRFDIQIVDLYCFMRKILEKCGWDAEIGRKMLRAYMKKRPLSQEEYENLRLRFVYPEKYWKVANYYYSHNKAWISEKNVEKLRIIIEQKQNWRKFSQICFK